MSRRKNLRMSFLICMMLSFPSISIALETYATTSRDSISKRVEEIFAEADELSALQKQRSREYLTSLTDEELAKIYAKATAPQQPRTSGINEISASMIEKVRKERPAIIEKLIKYCILLDRQENKDFRDKYNILVDKLAALGPKAVPAMSVHMGDNYRRTEHWALTKEALIKMEADAVEPLIDLTDNPDQKIRENTVYVLYRIGDARAKDTFLNALDDESGSVRKYATEGLIELGPDIVGQDRFIREMVVHLEDSSCIHECITGLGQYGDETAIESLRIIENCYPARKGFRKLDMRYPARRAINVILKRAGKPVKEVTWDDYIQRESTYKELLTATKCPNAAVRSCAISRLEQYKNEQTALFLIERINEEQNSEVLDQITRTLRTIIVPPKGSTEPVVSLQTIQKAFDAFLSKVATASPQETKGKIAAIQGCRDMLFAASLFNLPLRNIGQFKKIVHTDLSSAREVRIVCYLSITSIGRISPETGESWTQAERQELRQELAPLLDLPNPNIRLIECLGYIGDKSLTPRLMELLGHDDPDIRRFAVNALGQIGDSQALPALKNLAQTDPFKYENGIFGVREAAKTAIEQINKITPADIKDIININRNIY